MTETSAYSRAPPPGHQMGQRPMFPALHSTSVLSGPPTLSAEAAPGLDSLRHKLTSLPSVPSLQRETSLVSMASSQTSLSHHVSTPCLQPQEADMRSVRSNMSEPIFSATPTPGHGSHQNSLHSHQSQVTPGYPVLTEYSDENETSAYSRAPPPGHQMGQRPMFPASHSTPVLSRPPTPSAEAAPGLASLRYKLTSLPSVPSLQRETSLVSMASGQAGLSRQVSTPCLQPQEADMRSLRSNMSDPAFSHGPSHTPGQFSHQNSLHSHQPHVTPGYHPSSLSQHSQPQPLVRPRPQSPVTSSLPLQLATTRLRDLGDEGDLEMELGDQTDQGSLQYITGFIARKVSSRYHKEQKSNFIFLVWIANQGS